MNRYHPPRYPRRLSDGDNALMDVAAGLVAIACMIALTWVLLALGAST